MKRSSLIHLPLAATLCGMVLPASATVIVDDTWVDGSRNEQNLPVESQWFNGGTGATLTASPGSMLMGVPTGSASWTTYFAADATPVTLANVGDNLTLKWVFTTGTIGALNTSQNFRLALVDTSAAARLTVDGAPGTDTYMGYGMFMNMATTLGNANPYRLMERNAVTSDILGTSGNWTGLANGATSGNHGYDNSTQYTLTLSLTHNAANGLDITSTMAGGTLNNSGTATVSFTDATPNTFTYDTFSIRPSGSTSTADSFNTSEFRVDFTGQVPEPSVFALAGLGMFGLASAYRRRSNR